MSWVVALWKQSDSPGEDGPERYVGPLSSEQLADDVARRVNNVEGYGAAVHYLIPHREWKEAITDWMEDEGV